MGFYTTTSVTEKPHLETPSCAQKTASGKFFTYPIKTQYENRHNSLKTNQEKPLLTHETASGVFYYKFRHYSPELGRWPSRDPIEESGGVNLYTFVGNDSLNRWDMLGLKQYSAYTKQNWSYKVRPTFSSNWWDSVGSTRNVANIDAKPCCSLEYRDFDDYSNPDYTVKYKQYWSRVEHSFKSLTTASVSSNACTCGGKQVDGLIVTVKHLYRHGGTVTYTFTAGATATLGEKDVASVSGNLGATITIPPASHQSVSTFKYLVCPTGGANSQPSITNKSRVISNATDASGSGWTPAYWADLSGWTPSNVTGN